MFSSSPNILWVSRNAAAGPDTGNLLDAGQFVLGSEGPEITMIIRDFHLNAADVRD
jgi:hypothetical protein